MARRRYKKSGTGIGSVIAAVCLTLFLFSFAVVVILNCRWLYYADAARLGLDKETGLTMARIRANYDTLIRYNRLWFTGSLVFPDLPMSQTGAIHFREVKRIFDVIQIIFIFSGLVSLFFVIKRFRSRDYRYMKISGILSLIIPAAAGIAAALDWNRFFFTFHHIFFRNDYWLFDPKTDPVILILPDTYFLHCALGIILLIVGGSLICILVGSRSGRH